ncbi:MULTISPECIES: DnaD domain protein [unclassified Staphylococcus]|uniref:DnaD domain-containing protein n=1 Tax=unclassified Staphylococcus TaxID=91994 RepID=UPI00295EA712|nr:MULTISPECIES: DnaD domain protein [unclassified Staphylococcus]
MTGWISLHRSILNHWLFKEKRKFSRFEAWIDLLLLVNHTESKIMVDGELIIVKRGQRITSLRQLRERWNWSITKVNNFLKALEDETMIELKKDTKKTIITIVKYDFYQHDNLKKENKKDTEKTVEEQSKDTEKTQKETNNNDNNVNNNNNGNNENKRDELSNDAQFKDVFNLYQENIEQTPSPITIQKFTQDYEEFGKELLGYAIEKAALSNVHNYRFVDYLLKDWRKQNLNNLNAVEQYEQQRLQQKQHKNFKTYSREKTPKWLANRNQNNYKSEVNPNFEKERAAFRKQLKEDWGES